MSELFKSTVGWLLAGVHLLTVFFCLLYVNLIDKSSVLPVFILMILTAPWGGVLMILPAQLSMARGEVPSHQNDDLFFLVGMFIGGLINAFILYLLVFLLTKAFNYLSSRK
jgi:hypothetical protein